jgi:hypothetical protein
MATALCHSVRPTHGSIASTMAQSDIVAAVTPVSAFRSGALHAIASGFFYYYSGTLHLVTSRSVVLTDDAGQYPEELRLRLHNDPDDLTQHEEIVVPLQIDGEPAWQQHPTRPGEVDLITVELDGDELEMQYVIRAFSILDQVPREMELPLGEDVLVVGYPEGLFDDVHNLPIVRSASIASVYPVPFQGQPLGVIDANLPASTAGAPVLTRAASAVRTQDGQTTMGSGENLLAGILSARSPFASGDSTQRRAAFNAMFYPWIVPEIISQRAQ